jgi:hypothetical protein
MSASSRDGKSASGFPGGSMSHALKGALLSALVFPGLGQLALRHYKRGIALVLTVLVALVVIVIKAIQMAFTFLEKIESGGGIIDVPAISDAATQAITSVDNPMTNSLLLLITVCWIFGVVDAYRIGKKIDLGEHL